MASGYRSSNRRQNRSGLADHDIFEGLPVRHWRRGFVTVDPSIAPENTTQQNNIWAIDLPHGMPKDSHLLPQHSQDLLRAARSGKIYKRPVVTEEEEIDPEVALGDKIEKKEEPLQDHGFVAKAWKQVPRHLEGSDIEFLAKRRKGVITAAERSTVINDNSLVKTRVKRVDAIGNEYIQDMIVPMGKQAEGEVITIIPHPSTTTEGYIANAQSAMPKKKGLLKKKIKPVGRGKKKKLLPPTSTPNGSTVGLAPNSLNTIGIDSGNDATLFTANNEEMEMEMEMEIGEESMGNSEDGEGDEGDEIEDDDELTDSQSLPSSAFKSMPIEKVEESTVETVHQYKHPVKMEEENCSNELKIDVPNKSIPTSSFGSLPTNIISQGNHTTEYSMVAPPLTNYNTKIFQNTYENSSPFQTMPLPMINERKEDTRPRENDMLNIRNMVNCIDFGSKNKENEASNISQEDRNHLELFPYTSSHPSSSAKPD